jgi:DNA-binding Lrp family transcriptional regulator
MRTKRDLNGQVAQESSAEAVEIGPELAATKAGSHIDELDAAILRYLERHGRATNYEVGEAVGLSASAASRRIQALEASKAIRGYHAEIDDRLLGKRMTVFIRVTLERQSAAVVRRSKSIGSCHLMDGHYDYTLVVRVADIEDYSRLHQHELSRLPGVTRLETSFALRDVMEGRS